MFYLPRTLTKDVRTLLEQVLEDLPLEQTMEKVTEKVRQLFEAPDCLFFLYRFTDQGREAFASHVASDRGAEALEKLRDLSESWLKQGIDEKILRDFRSRMTCVSYSAFAWPYGSIAKNSAHPELTIPRDFTLLLPVNSQLSVSHESDPGFLGYFALFFDAFPQLADRTIQLITSLPQVLSDLVLAYLRRESDVNESELNIFAHEMKRGLLFMADALERYDVHGEDNEKLRGVLGRNIQVLIQRAGAILLADRVGRHELTVSRLPICLNDLVEEVAANFAVQLRHNHTQMIIELDEELPLSPIDPAVFPTVIENLIENSLRYVGENSCIYLRTRQVAESLVVLEVLDDGQPIPEEEWTNIFQKHYRLKTGDEGHGNGLGLYLVKKIVEAHEGRVYPRKSEEMKTCFVVELPTMEKI